MYTPNSLSYIKILLIEKNFFNLAALSLSCSTQAPEFLGRRAVGARNLSSKTRDVTHVPCAGRWISKPLDCRGSSCFFFE